MQAPLRTALSGKTFSPEYLRTMHAALVDMQRQLGAPTLFLTTAPYEWSAPYHVVIENELKKAFRSRTWLPAAETCHLAHVLKQAIVGFLARSSRKIRWGEWRRHSYQLFRTLGISRRGTQAKDRQPARLSWARHGACALLAFFVLCGVHRFACKSFSCSA